MKNLLGKIIVIFCIIILTYIGIGASPSITTNDYAQYDAEIITSAGLLTLTPLGVDAISRTQGAVGDTQPTAVTMSSSGNPSANTALTKGNWAYKVDVQAITGTTPALTDFQVDLKVNGTITGTLYVSSDAVPTTGELVTLTFDLGTAVLGNEQSFVIQAIEL
jgi:hypothetical protein